MAEERYSLEKLVENCNSIRYLIDMLSDFESKALEFMVDVNADDTISIGVKHYKAQLSTVVDKDWRVKPSVIYVDEPWHWYTIKVPAGFVFDD